MKSYELSAEASLDDFAAFDFLGEHSPRAALAWEDRMLFASARLAEWPHAGRVRREYAPDYLRFWVEGDYLVVQDPTADPLNIVALLHGAQNVTAMLAHRLDSNDPEASRASVNA